MISSKKQLIIGQGLAGSMLAMAFWERGIEFEIVSEDLPYSASKVAAGIMNPITGKRLALSWRYGEFFEIAQNRYSQMEKILQVSLFQKFPVIRIFRDEKEIAAFEKRKTKPEFSQWLGRKHPPDAFGDVIHAPMGSFEILGAAALDTELLVQKMKEWLNKKRLIADIKYDHEDLLTTQDGVTWNDNHFENAFFCEGFRIQDNPWFQKVPQELAAGEIQTVSISAKLPDGILNSGKWLRPTRNDQYLAGATYTWKNLESPPSQEGMLEMETGLKKFLHASPRVINRRTGVRPVIKDRKPILGSHPDYPQLKVFNGLGSKGSLMAPLLAKQLSEVLLITEKKLDPEIDVGRFSKFFM